MAVRLMLLSLGVCAFFAMAFQAGAEDKVTLHKNNEVVSGHIKTASVTAIEVEIKAAVGTGVATRTFTPAEVADVEWDVKEEDFRTGMAAFKAGKYSDAVGPFQDIISDKAVWEKIPALARPSLYFYLGESQYRMGKAGDAIPTYEKLMKDFQTSYHVPMAVGSLVDAAIQSGKFEKVPPLLAKLKELGGENRALADYYEGLMLLAQKKNAPADAKFASAATTATAATTKGMALMGQAQCAIAENNLPKARELAQKALAASPTPVVAGAAHLIVGEALLAEVTAENPAGEKLEKKLMDALLEFVRVIEQYEGDERTEPQALLKAGDTLMRLSKLNGRAGDVHRARYLYSKLLSDARYRNSRWGAEAEKAMKGARK